MRLQLICAAITLFVGANLHATPVTFQFEGHFEDDGPFFRAGDAVSGRYTVETNSPWRHSGEYRQYVTNFGGGVLHSEFTFGGRNFSSKWGEIHVRDDKTSRPWNDAYIVTLTSDTERFLAPGLELNFFQISLYDNDGDLIEDESIQGSSLDFSRAADAYGRISYYSELSGWDERRFTVLTLTAVPEPATITLGLVGASLLLLMGGRYSRQG